jgi:hypothetical protein
VNALVPKIRMSPRDLRTAQKSGGFTWMENAILDELRAVFGDSAYGVMAIYGALCHHASDESKRTQQQVATFKAGLSVIAQYAGCSRRSAMRWLRALEGEHFIVVHHVPRTQANAREKEFNTYTLPPYWEVERIRREFATTSVTPSLVPNSH